MYYIYGALESPATEKAENLLVICKKPYKLFIYGRDFTINQLHRLVPGTQVIPHIYMDTEYIGGVKELYDHLYTMVKFDEERNNEK